MCLKIFGLAPTASTAQTPTQREDSPTQEKPTTEAPLTQPAQPTTDNDKPIELIVSATRTEEDVQNVPRSVTVITREQIEEQTTVNRDLTSILANTVTCNGPSSESQQSFTQNLRGRPPLVLVDGVPITSNIDNDTSIDPAAIERIEVIRGPSATYGDGAAGGVINIITRKPDQDRVVSEAEIGVRSVGNFKSGSFGNFINYGFSGKQGDVNFVASFTRDSFGTPFDAEGDRIPSSPQKVDSYELGIRGRWNNFQASLAGFYSYSALGTTVQFEDFGTGNCSILRSPQRNYGIELALDWQPSDKWKLGSTLTWSEGEREESEQSGFVAITSYEISPLKLTAYLENETLPGWSNRLQALYVGSRDRAFDAEVDPIGIDSYLLVDLVSSLKLGDGSLSLGVRNLLNNQYLNISNQLSAGFDDSYALASRGRSFTLNYRWSW
ncbi:TonB-dependent receptor plug domain-containing protein [Calothrix sp. CCY 0018]|uniref:TonB-dependent receptor plug domain-containing protein n=1 Tax=Calothrix sp. CCY 0018 TaxID=3103864 RepID=UPI0039C5CE11